MKKLDDQDLHPKQILIQHSVSLSRGQLCDKIEKVSKRKLCLIYDGNSGQKSLTKPSYSLLLSQLSDEKYKDKSSY